jgi:hypothetical protein
MLILLAWLGAVLVIAGALSDALNGPCSTCRCGCHLLGGLLTLPYCVTVHAGPAIVLVTGITLAGALGVGRAWAASGSRRRDRLGWPARGFGIRGSAQRAGRLSIPLGVRKRNSW